MAADVHHRAGMKRIAVVRTCALGDAVQCTPLLQQIKADEPGAHLQFFTSPNARPLFEGAAFVDEVIQLREEWLSIRAGRRGLWRAWWEVACHGPLDAMISLESTWMRNAGSVLVKAQAKAGLSFVEARKPFELFTHPLRITGDSRKVECHASQQYLNLWLGITKGTDRGFGYNMSHLLDGKREARHRICLAPGTGNVFARISTKQWPTSFFIALGEYLIADGFEVVYVGGLHDLEGLKPPSGAVDQLGKTNVHDVAALLHQSLAMVGNDSGLFHLAQAVGCPALGLFGPTSARFTGAFRSPNARTLSASLACMPCYQSECALEDALPKPCCMNALSVERVHSELMSML